MRGTLVTTVRLDLVFDEVIDFLEKTTGYCGIPKFIAGSLCGLDYGANFMVLQDLAELPADSCLLADHFQFRPCATLT